MANTDSVHFHGIPRTPVFATTRWTLVMSAAETQSPDGAAALEQLCGAYWYPLYAYARRRGHSPEEAQDLTQGFFAHMIQNKFFQDADRERGRFRAFLLGGFQNFLNNQRRAANALKRGGGEEILSLNYEDAEGRLLNEPTHGVTPETLFEKEWAQSLVNRVLDLLRAEHTAAGTDKKFDAMSAHLLDPDSATSYAQLAQELGMTEGAVKTAMHRLRRRYSELFRGEVAALVGSEAEVEDEIRHMAAALAS